MSGPTRHPSFPPERGSGSMTQVEGMAEREGMTGLAGLGGMVGLEGMAGLGGMVGLEGMAGWVKIRGAT